ncbi:MAG: hypothetical protein ACOCQ4_01500 [bacterium]
MSKKVMVIIFLLFFVCGQANACKDDPRLENIHEVLAQVESGTFEKPLMLTADTWVNIYPEILDKLGDNIAICPGIGLVDGQPFSKVELSFDIMLEMLLEAVVDRDKERAEYIRNTFIPKSVDAIEAIQLEQPIYAESESVVEFLYDYLSIPYYEKKRHLLRKWTETFEVDGQDIRTYIAWGNEAKIYEALGGLADDERDIYIETRVNHPKLYRDQNVFALWEDGNIVPRVVETNPHTIDVLKRIGFNVYHDDIGFKYYLNSIGVE